MTNRPFVTTNFVITADGRVSTRKFTPTDFSSPRDKRRLLEIRAECDAVMVGVRTIAADRMSMGMPPEDLRDAREARGKPAYPLRVLLSKSGRISPDLPVFAKDFSPIHIFTTERMPRRVQAALADRATLHLSPGSEVDLAGMLRTLRRDCGVRRLVCEGGPQVFRALLQADLVDELHVTIAPRVFGGAKTPTLTGIPGDYLPASTRLELRDFRPIGSECFLRYRVARGAVSPKR